jgi:Ulp1 family protease
VKPVDRVAIILFPFWQRLSGSYNYARLAWTERYKLLDCDRLLIPAIRESNHFVLFEIDLNKKRFWVYDSFAKPPSEQAEQLLATFLTDYAPNTVGTLLDDLHLWPTEGVFEQPLQHDSSSCGVFLCAFLEQRAKNEPINITQNDIKDFRRRMAVALVRKELPKEHVIVLQGNRHHTSSVF